MIVLSIDPGESMVGYTISKDYQVLRWGHIKRKKCKQSSKTQEFITNKIQNILSQQKVDHVVIELNTENSDKQRVDEREIVECIKMLKIPYSCFKATEYISHLKLDGYDKRIDNLFRERQKEVYKYFKVMNDSRHNIDCLLMTIYFLQTHNIYLTN